MTSTAHPINKDWDGFDWVRSQYHEKNVNALEEYRAMPHTSKRGLIINAELRTVGRMSLAKQRALLVNVETGLYSFEIAKNPFLS